MEQSSCTKYSYCCILLIRNDTTNIRRLVGPLIQVISVTSSNAARVVTDTAESISYLIRAVYLVYIRIHESTYHQPYISLVWQLRLIMWWKQSDVTSRFVDNYGDMCKPAAGVWQGRESKQRVYLKQESRRWICSKEKTAWGPGASFISQRPSYVNERTCCTADVLDSSQQNKRRRAVTTAQLHWVTWERWRQTRVYNGVVAQYTWLMVTAGVLLVYWWPPHSTSRSSRRCESWLTVTDVCRGVCQKLEAQCRGFGLQQREQYCLLRQSWFSLKKKKLLTITQAKKKKLIGCSINHNHQTENKREMQSL